MAISSIGRVDWAVWDPIDGRSTKTAGLVRMTLHTAAANVSDIYGPGKGPSGTYAHAFNPTSGKLRQHQEAHHWAYADLDANGRTFAVEHQDAGPSHGVPFSENQLDNAARLFADLVTHSRTCPSCNVPNRLATVDDTRGLAWHRLGVPGNFPPYNPHDRRTWCSRDTGEYWTEVYGKACPWDQRIDQVDDIYARAQDYLNGDTAPDDDGEEGDDMAHVVRSRETNQPLGNTDDWQTIKVQEDDAGGPVHQLVLGPAKIISGLAYIHATGLGKDGRIDARVYVIDDPDESGKASTRVGRAGTHVNLWAPKGGVNGVLPFHWNLGASGKTGVKRRLQLEVRTASDAAVIDNIRAEMWIQD